MSEIGTQILGQKCQVILYKNIFMVIKSQNDPAFFERPNTERFCLDFGRKILSEI